MSQSHTRRSVACKTFFLWFDAEMTGLDIDHDELLEVAGIMTDEHLNVLDEGPELVIHQPEFVLKRMDQWCKETHGTSGLTHQVRRSETTTNDAEEAYLTFVKPYTHHGSVYLAGNSVYQDKAFLRRLMPRLNALLHYRVVDVSTVKVLGRAWYPQSPGCDFPKPDNHRAKEDIRASIEELKHYQKHFFKDSEVNSEVC